MKKITNFASLCHGYMKQIRVKQLFKGFQKSCQTLESKKLSKISLMCLGPRLKHL